MHERRTVLLVDDDPDVRDALTDYLLSHRFRLTCAGDAETARRMLDETSFDLALVDINLPGEDGLSFSRHLREHTGTAIIMLTHAGTVVDRIVGLEMGADDYLPKPFDPRELLARMRSVLRRLDVPDVQRTETGCVSFGQCILDLRARRLRDAAGCDVTVTPLEFDLMQAFVRQPNRVLSRDYILNLSDGRDWDPTDRSVDLRIVRLRRKIEPEPARPRYIRAIRNAGYLFDPSGGGA